MVLYSREGDKMALKKTCMCGKIIDYAISYCEDCVAKVKERNKQYDKRARYSRDNAKYNKFYHSMEIVSIIW